MSVHVIKRKTKGGQRYLVRLPPWGSGVPYRDGRNLHVPAGSPPAKGLGSRLACYRQRP